MDATVLQEQINEQYARAHSQYQAWLDRQVAPWNRIQFDEWLSTPPRSQEFWEDYLARLNAKAQPLSL